MNAPYRRSAVFMDTIVSIEVVEPSTTTAAAIAAVARAFARFGEVEAHCNRFDPASELRALTARIGEAVPVSVVLFETVRFALAVAAASNGAFDPTLGATLEHRGFNHEYRSGQRIAPTLPTTAKRATYRDVQLNPARRTITLVQPLVLDLGAVAKGMAMDLAAQELHAFANYTIEAGGDVLVGGYNADGGPWRIGIQHPREPDAIFTTLALTDAAVCTSGDYERRSLTNGESHLLDPRAGHSPRSIASATVVAATAMAADALSTAAFVLGPQAGITFLERQGVAGLLVTPALELFTTEGFARYEE